MKLSRKLKTELDQIFEDAKQDDTLITDEKYFLRLFRVRCKTEQAILDYKIILKRLDRISTIKRKKYLLEKKEKQLISENAETPYDKWMV